MLLRKILATLGAFVAPLAARAQTPFLGPEMLVNTYTTNIQRLPSVAIDPSGNFVVVWQSASQDGSGPAIEGQRFNPVGDPVGGEFQVNTYTTNRQYVPKVAVDGSGNFVVVWTSYAQIGDDKGGIFGQRYDSSGDPVGGEFHVNTYTTNYQYGPSVAMDASGSFVVVWTSIGQDGDGYGVFGQRYDASGTPQGTEFQVNTTTTGAQFAPAVAMENSGTFVVVWSSGTAVPNYDVVGQRYNSAGTPLGGEFMINTQTGIDAAIPAIAMDDDGDFAVVWRQYDADASGIFGQRFDGAGRARETSSRSTRTPREISDTRASPSTAVTSSSSPGTASARTTRAAPASTPSASAIRTCPSARSSRSTSSPRAIRFSPPWR
jgi:hypothetical protein